MNRVLVRNLPPSTLHLQHVSGADCQNQLQGSTHLVVLNRPVGTPWPGEHLLQPAGGVTMRNIETYAVAMKESTKVISRWSPTFLG